MDIYSILASKPHNPHYLNRYITFITECQLKNLNYNGYTEKHHICPKAKDMFPEYRSFKEHAWNCAVLTARQHFIAHWILYKTYQNSNSQKESFWLMLHTREGIKINSRLYESAKIEYVKYKKRLVRVFDENGKSILIEKTDKRYVSGKLKYWGKGLFPAKDVFGNTFMISKEDPRYVSGDLVHTSKNVMKDHIRITNGIENRTIDPNNEIPNGWRKGLTQKSQVGTIYITNGVETKKMNSNREEIPEGWWRGITHKNKFNYSNRMWITNGIESKLVDKFYVLPDGWRKGRK